jgi:Flp pilus assembly protein TadG
VRYNKRRRKTRAAVLLEFVMTIPFTLALSMFIMDAGRAYLAAGSLNDATWRAARVAAAVGGTDVLNTDGQSYAQAAFKEVIKNAPGTIESSTPPELIVLEGGSCVVYKTDAPGSYYVKVTGSATVPSFTNSILKGLGFGALDTWVIRSAAVAVCEKDKP